MIYEFPSADEPIRQGDIFVGLPRVEVSLQAIPVVEEGDVYETPWADVAVNDKTIRAVLPLRSVSAIVITQDCDNIHGQDVSLCEVRKFTEVERKAQHTTKPKAWTSVLTQHARINQKWFYLPPDETIGFSDKMAADFTVSIRVPRADLESFREHRKGRLNPTADEHFRERLSEFFRRYPYDEWYALDPAELAEYRKVYPTATPFPWQE